jgi:hypothetical protein
MALRGRNYQIRSGFSYDSRRSIAGHGSGDDGNGIAWAFGNLLNILAKNTVSDVRGL